MPSIILQVVYAGSDDEVVQTMALDAKRFIESQDGQPFARVFCHEERSLSLIGKRLEIPPDLLLTPGQCWQIADQAGVSRRNLTSTIRMLVKAIKRANQAPDEWPQLLRELEVIEESVRAVDYVRAYENDAVCQAMRAAYLLDYGPILQIVSTKVVQWLRKTYS